MFNVYDAQGVIDADGTDLPDLNAVRHMALRHAGEILDDVARRKAVAEDWHMEVAQETGRVVFRLAFHIMDVPAAGEPDRSERPMGTRKAPSSAITGPDPSHARD